MPDREALTRVSHLVELTFDEDDDDLGVCEMVAQDACDLVESYWRIRARIVDRFTAFSLGELQLLQLGLAVIGEQARVDHRLEEVWDQLLKDVGRAATARATDG